MELRPAEDSSVRARIGDVVHKYAVEPVRRKRASLEGGLDLLALNSKNLFLCDAPLFGGISLGDEGTGVFALQAGLTRLGYDIAPSGRFDEATAIIVTAFQRHWRPARVDGVADGETRARLVHLLRAAG